MRSVNAIDATAVHSIEQLYEKCEKRGITLVLSHVNEQPERVLRKSGLYEKIKEENICVHIDEALERAAKLQE